MQASHLKCKSLNVVILGDFIGFPYGMAAASRVRYLAAGLLDCGVKVTVFNIVGINRNTSTIKPSIAGVAWGIPYEYLSKVPIRSSSWWRRRIEDFVGFGNLFIKLITLKMKYQIDVVIFYSRNSLLISNVALFCRLLRIKTVAEVCEWPITKYNSNHRFFNNAYKYCTKAVLKADAALPISAYIENQLAVVANLSNTSLPMLRIPIIVDVKEGQSSNTDSLFPYSYLFYSASLAYFDIIKLLIDVIKELDNRGVVISLIITGTGEPIYANSLIDYATNLGIQERINLLGWVDEAKLDKLQTSAKALLAPLYDTLENQARFPTKIGHYLASGTPVISTRVGDVATYLFHEKNAYLADGCTPTLIADTVESILSNPILAHKVGLAGKDLAKNEFDYRIHGINLYNFLLQVVTSR